MKTSFPEPTFGEISFDTLIRAVRINTEKLGKVGQVKPSSFHDDVTFFCREWLPKYPDKDLTEQQLKSVAMHLIENQALTKELMKNQRALFSIFILLKASRSVTFKRYMLDLYFNHYFLFRSANKNEIESLITKMLLNFDGKNKRLKVYKKHIEYLFIPKSLLSRFSNKESLQREFLLSADSEYFKNIIILELIEGINRIRPGGWDDELFISIQSYSNYPYDSDISVGEYAVRSMIKVMMDNALYKYEKWIDFIISLIGDPRTASFSSSHSLNWNRIGQEFKDFMIRLLSQEDLELFLEALSDPEYDDRYQYRKAFWKPFKDYVVYTKLFVTKKEFSRLPENMRKRFAGENSSYSFISDNNRSFIYMDFGEIKVIEGTHNATARVYRGIPIDLTKSNYHYSEFYISRMAVEKILAKVTHQNSEKGYWQSKMLNVIKKHKRNVSLDLVDLLF